MSSDVSMINGVRDIPYTGKLKALLVPTDSDRECQLLGVITDDRVTLIVDCLHADEEVAAFRRTCKDNAVEVRQLFSPMRVPCPPPPNQLQLAAWAASLFKELASAR